MAISSRYTRGIEIQIGGNATKLKTALDSANRSIRTTQSELDTLKNSLKLEWDATKFQRAQALAQKALSETEAKAELLRKALAAMGDPASFSATQKEQYEALRRELSYVEVSAQRAKAQLEEVSKSAEQAKVDQLTSQLEDADAALDTTGAKLDSVRSKLERNWDAKQFDQAQELAQQAITQTEAKAELLRQKLAAMEELGTEKTSAEYQRLEKQLVETEAAAEQAHKQLQSINQIRLDHLNKGLDEAARRLSTAGNALTTGLTVPLAAAGVASVNFSSDMQEAINKVEVAFGGAADSVKEWSSTTLNSIGLAQGTALDMAALFGDMATSMGYSQDAAAQMSMALVNLAADLASFKNIGIDQASTALKSIFTGETESLKELGVVMTQANLEAYALAEGYTTAYTAMDQAQQVAVRYQYVLANTQNAQGNFARTSDSTANQLRIFRESLKEAAATAGDELLPIITPIIGKLNELIQTFGDLDEGTQKAVVQTGLFLAALGPMLKVTGGITTAVKAGITVYQTLRTVMAANTAATTAATAAQTGLNAAMAANPIGLLVTAIGTLLAVLGSFAVSAALTAESTDTLASSINEARQAYEDTRAELQESQASTLSMVDALARLAEEEHKTSAEKAAMLELVEQLNEAVPSLSLAYDAQTDSLNLTAEAIRSLAEAEYARQEQEAAVGRLSEAYQEQISIANELEAAEESLQEAKERYAEFDGVETRNSREETSFTAAQGALIAAQGQYDRLTAAQEQNAAEIARLEQEYGKYNATAAQTAQALEDTGTAADTAADRLAALTGVLGQTQGAYELLAEAQEQQNETGYLELDTVVKLLEEYPQLSGYLVEASNGYLLADGALQDYISTQRAEYALALNEAQSAADAIVTAEADKINAINATTLATKDQLTALAELYQSMGANADNLAEGVSYYAKANEYREAAQALADAGKSLEDYDRITASMFRESAGTRSSRRASGSTSSKKTEAAKDEGTSAMEELQEWLDDVDHQIFLWSKDEAKTQAIVDLYQTMMDRVHELAEEFRAQGYEENSDEIQELQTLWWGYAEEREKIQTESSEKAAAAKQEAYEAELADLQYFLDMDIISEQQYYEELARLRDQYLEENSDAWRQANVQLHNYLEQCRQEELDAAQQAYDAQLESLKAAYEAQVSALKESLEEEKAALKDRYDAEKDAAKDAYEARKDQIEAELKAEKERLNAIIDGINEEIQARRELREDEEQDDAIAEARKRLEAAEAQRDFARNEEERREWEKEVARLQEALDKAIQDKEDTQFYREKEEEKEKIEAEIDAAEEAADQAKKEAKEDYEAEIKRLEEEYKRELEYLVKYYEAAISQAGRDYESAKDRAESAKDKAEKEKEELDPEILDIAKKENVEYNIAKDMWEANQKYKDVEGYVPYGSGKSSKKSAGSSSNAAARAASMLAGAVETAARTVTKVVNQVTRSNSASITYNAGGGMTEGQVARTVRKVLDELDR
jgi:chromosome segregation ATPase